MPTKSYEIKHGVVSRAAEDEPLFVLRAQDDAAVFFVKMYKTYLEAIDAPKEKIVSATAEINAFETWMAENKKAKKL